MTDTTRATSDPGLLARAIGVIVSPGTTFQAVSAHPRPAGVLLLCCLVISLASSLPLFTERGQQQLLDMQVRQVERFTGQPATEQMYEAMQGQVAYAPYTTFVGAFISAPVFVLLIGAVFWFVFNAILGGTATFKQVLAIVTHSQVIAALAAVAAAPLMYLQGAITPMGPFNLGVLVPMLDPDGLAARVLGAINIFVIWQVVVAAIGLGVLYRRKTRNIAIGLLAAYMGLAVGLSVLFSAMFRS